MSRIWRVFLAIAIVLVVIFAAAAVTISVLFGKTFEEIGISNEPLLNGKSIADMQLQHYKPKEIWPLASSLFRNNSSLVNYAPSSDELTATNKIFAQSSIKNKLNAVVQYSKLIYESATFYDQTIVASGLLVLTDKQLCAVLNSTVKQAPNDLLLKTSADILDFLGSRQIKQILDLLEEFDVTVEQIRLFEKDEVPHLQILMSLDISQQTKDLYVPFLGRPNPRVYVDVDYCLSVTETGFISLSTPMLSVNGQDAALSRAVLDGLFIALADEGADPMTTQSLADSVAAFVGVVFEHVGSVGNNTSLGMSGVDATAHTLCFVANT